MIADRYACIHLANRDSPEAVSYLSIVIVFPLPLNAHIQ